MWKIVLASKIKEIRNSCPQSSSFTNLQDSSFQAKSATLRTIAYRRKKYIGNRAHRQRLRACRASVWGKAVGEVVVLRRFDTHSAADALSIYGSYGPELPQKQLFRSEIRYGMGGLVEHHAIILREFKLLWNPRFALSFFFPACIPLIATDHIACNCNRTLLRVFSVKITRIAYPLMRWNGSSKLSLSTAPSGFGGLLAGR